jgi:hypothetical protein
VVFIDSGFWSGTIIPNWPSGYALASDLTAKAIASEVWRQKCRDGISSLRRSHCRIMSLILVDLHTKGGVPTGYEPYVLSSPTRCASAASRSNSASKLTSAM